MQSSLENKQRTTSSSSGRQTPASLPGRPKTSSRRIHADILLSGQNMFTSVLAEEKKESDSLDKEFAVMRAKLANLELRQQQIKQQEQIQKQEQKDKQALERVVVSLSDYQLAATFFWIAHEALSRGLNISKAEITPALLLITEKKISANALRKLRKEDLDCLIFNGSSRASFNIIENLALQQDHQDDEQRTLACY